MISCLGVCLVFEQLTVRSHGLLCDSQRSTMMTTYNPVLVSSSSPVLSLNIYTDIVCAMVTILVLS